MLDDFLYRAIRTADDAAIARSIRHDGRQHGGLCSGSHMLIVELAQQVARQQRRIAAEHHDDTLLILQQLFGLQHGMTGTELLRLRDALRPVTDRLADHVTAKACDDDIALGPGGLRCIEHMHEHRLAARLVQDLRQLRFHARTFTGGQYDCY